MKRENSALRSRKKKKKEKRRKKDCPVQGQIGKAQRSRWAYLSRVLRDKGEDAIFDSLDPVDSRLDLTFAIDHQEQC